MATTYYVDPAATGNNDGSDWDNAWTSLQTAADTATAGDTVYCQGTQALSAAIDFDTNSGTYDGGFIKFIGVKDGTTNAPPQATDYDSGNGDSGYFILDGQDNAINGIYVNAVAMVWLENIKIHSCNGTGGIASASAYARNWVFNNVWCHDNSGHGCSSAAYMRYIRIVRCKFTNNGGDGYYRLSGTGIEADVVASEFIGNGGDGLDAYGASATIFGCVFHANGKHGIDGEGRLTCINCVFDGNTGNGLNTRGDGDEASVVIGCRFTNQSGSGDLGLAVGGNERVLLLASYFGGNDTDITASRYDIVAIDGTTTNVTLAGSETDHGYVNPATDDFNLDATKAANTRSIAVELP